MSIGGVGGANDMMAQLMQILLQGMQEQMEMSEKAMAIGIETGIIADKMSIAQNIIDVYV